MGLEIFFVRVWRNIQLYLTSTAGRGREGVIQISYNWSPLLIYIANFTSHNFQQPLYRGREGRLVSLSIMRANVLVAEQV